MIKLFYQYRHIPSGTQKEREIEFNARTIREAREQLLELMNDWNQKQPGIWQFWD